MISLYFLWLRLIHTLLTKSFMRNRAENIWISLGEREMMA